MFYKNIFIYILHSYTYNLLYSYKFYIIIFYIKFLINMHRNLIKIISIINKVLTLFYISDIIILERRYIYGKERIQKTDYDSTFN